MHCKGSFTAVSSSSPLAPTTSVRSPALCSFQNSTPSKQLGYTAKLTERGLTGMEMCLPLMLAKHICWKFGTCQKGRLGEDRGKLSTWQQRWTGNTRENSHHYHSGFIQHTTSDIVSFAWGFFLF